MQLDKLSKLNPWWTVGSVPEGLSGKPRREYGLLLRSIAVKEVTVITGVRRSGKSTLMYQMISHLLSDKTPPEQILFVNLEDSRLAEDSLEDIYECYRGNMNPGKKAYVFLDEVHKRGNWESWVRSHYDADSNCKFVVSGSSSYLLKKEYSTLLTGRNLSFEVFPFSFREFLAFKGIKVDIGKLKKGLIGESVKHAVHKALNEYLEEGGFPGAFFQQSEFKTRTLAQYFDDIIYKDIVARYNLNGQKTRDLALYFITNISGVVSLRNIRGTLGLSYESTKDYLSYFKEAFLFFTADHFSYSMKEQKTRSSKIYCIDNGMRNAVSFKFSNDLGKLAENLVFLELVRREKDVYYWSGKGEVDFIVKEKDQTLAAVNVSYTDEIDERETRALKEFKAGFPKAKELIVITKNIGKKESGITFIPLWKWLLEK